MEPDAKVQTETTSGERIQTGIAGMESRRAEGICWWRKESGFHGRAGLFAAKRNTKRHKIRTPLHGIWKPEKGSTKGLRGGETNRIPRDTSSPGVRQTHSKPETGGRKECRVLPLLLQAAHPRLLQLHWPPELQRKQHTPLKTTSRK